MYTQLTFAQTESMINRMARGFHIVGVQKGERVCVFITPCLEFILVVTALYRIGAIVVLIDLNGRDGLLSCVERIIAHGDGRSTQSDDCYGLPFVLYI